ncbi:MAG: hypothetical protein WC742_12040 [Gallionellaceae bacterium]|jgi:hypothetical protein
MSHSHIVISDLFLPQSEAKRVCTGISLPALEKILARSSHSEIQTHALDEALCELFGIPDLAIAPVTLLADGIDPGSAYWLRADPVHLRLDRSHMILQTNVAPSQEEAAQFCATLNQHFAADGLKFFAPHPLRWYARLGADPNLVTQSVYQAEGRNSRHYLPQGEAALNWHSVMNEVQMLLFGHPAYRVCAARGALPPNSVWFWGGGRAHPRNKLFNKVYCEFDLAELFAKAANIPVVNSVTAPEITGADLYVWDGLSAALRRGDYYSWRESLLNFEHQIAAPLLEQLSAGKLKKITLDVLQEDKSNRFELTRANLWKVWKRPVSIATYGEQD